KKKPTVQELNATSMRKLKTMLKEELIAKAAAGEGKRLALAELDDNAGGVDC
ncbi:Os02g0699500, partial [Oryza sativa Japonica Group]